MDNSDNEDGFYLRVVTYDLLVTEVTLEPNTTRYDVPASNFESGFDSSLCAYVRATSLTAGDSPEISGCFAPPPPPPPPAAPSNLQFECTYPEEVALHQISDDVCYGEVVITWTDNSDNEDGFYLNVVDGDLSIIDVALGPDTEEYIVDATGFESGFGPSHCASIKAYSLAGGESPEVESCGISAPS